MNFSSGSSGGSSKTPCSCPGSIPNDESLAEEAESESPEPESQAKDFAYACRQMQNVLFWKILIIVVKSLIYPYKVITIYVSTYVYFWSVNLIA